MSKLNVLVVWEMVPESTDLYLVEMDQSEYEYLKQANGVMVNGDCTEDQENAAMYFNFAFQEGRYDGDTEQAAEYNFKGEDCVGRWVGSKLTDESVPFTADKIISTGFFL